MHQSNENWHEEWLKSEEAERLAFNDWCKSIIKSQIIKTVREVVIFVEPLRLVMQVLTNV